MRYHYTTPVRPLILSTARIPRNTPTVLVIVHVCGDLIGSAPELPTWPRLWERPKSPQISSTLNSYPS